MPIYEFKCKKCDKTIELFRNMDECSYPIDCYTCGSPLSRIYSPLPFAGIFHEYTDIGSGQVIKDRRDYKDLERNGFIGVSPKEAVKVRSDIAKEHKQKLAQEATKNVTRNIEKSIKQFNN